MRGPPAQQRQRVPLAELAAQGRAPRHHAPGSRNALVQGESYMLPVPLLPALVRKTGRQTHEQSTLPQA